MRRTGKYSNAGWNSEYQCVGSISTPILRVSKCATFETESRWIMGDRARHWQAENSIYAKDFLFLKNVRSFSVRKKQD